MSAIAIIGMACRYAEARSPRQLWENVLTQRRSFRRVPSVRLRLEDYSGEDLEDRIYLRTAAVLEDYEFDRVRFQVSKDTFASTDLTHWLALEVAYKALEDAKLLEASESQRERVGVYVGNSLTGEFSRANLLRLRWPYVRRVLGAVLQKNPAYQNGDLQKVIQEIETLYKAPFPPTTEESLAGGLSNTIAGRICNYFNFKGGGYTVDGACASSLLAVTTACSALESGDVDIAIAGGVDLSLDPFELAGFSKLNALASDKMRVFDAKSAGFLPGEGCGMVVLMRHEEAAADHRSAYAVLRGWGVSSDGNGGLTRPEAMGQQLALRRAYQRAGYGIDSVRYFEGHGTGTPVGDAAELQALTSTRREAEPNSLPAALGSIKANIGHTKAAAGVAGLIKAAIAVQAKILPPTTGCETPHSELLGEKPMLRVLKEGELWPEAGPVRAGVSAMGFGGINSHVTLESVDRVRRRSFTGSEQQQLTSAQDCELFLFHAADCDQLSTQLKEILELAGEISFAELTDLAASLAIQAANGTPEDGVRAACVASTPAELESNISKLMACCEAGTEQHIDTAQGVFLAVGADAPEIAFLFTGQGSPVYTHGGIWSRRFPGIRDLYERANLPRTPSIATETAQPCVVAASLAGLHALNLCGIEAGIALGHSLGEITALSWAGGFGAEDLLRIVSARGRMMAQMATPSGSMASIRASCEEVKKRINGDGLAIAAYNSPLQTVVSGDAQAIRRFAERLRPDGVVATILPVSHAFHSPLVANVASSFHDYLQDQRFATLQRPVVSTVTGTILEDDTDLHELLTSQITVPVRFAGAVGLAGTLADLLIEVGPGTVLSGIAAECTDKPIIPLNAGGESLRGLLLAIGAAFALGSKVKISALFRDRFVRPFDLKRRHRFLQNPCETIIDSLPATPSHPTPVPAAHEIPFGTDAIEVLRTLIAQRTELPLANIKPESRFLDDLHLNSITVSQIMLQASAQLHVAIPAAPTEYANATIAEAATTLEGIRHQEPGKAIERVPRGVDSWIRVLAVELVEQQLRVTSAGSHGAWQLLATLENALQLPLQEELNKIPGSGVICLVPIERDEKSAAFLLECVQTALQQNVSHVAFAGKGAAALARSLYLEHPRLKVTVVEVPFGHPKAAQWIAEEIQCASGFTEVHYDAAGIRRVPRLKVLWPEESRSQIGLGPEDVLLVSGGGKGIAAECALALARESKCSLALLGRSSPARDRQLDENLQRFRESGVAFRYFAADVSNADEVTRAIQQIQVELGNITALLHGAGANSPKRLEEITAADVHHTLAPKLVGLRNILGQINPQNLRLMVTFGSIIARTGLHGEGHYGLANDWLGELVERWQEQHPACRCLNLEWSVWAGTGMGQRLGVLDSLVRQGITPLPLDDAIATLKIMLGWKQAPVSSIVTSRFGNLPTLEFFDSEIPLRRFLEHIEVHYPGIELVADATLSTDTDPYVSEHVFQGEQLLPAVCGIEAMAQVAITLEGCETGELPEFQNLRFEHPIVIPARQPVRIRIAGLRKRPGAVSVVIRCSSTSFQVDHFSGECVFDGKHQIKEAAPPQQDEDFTLPMNPDHDLYGPILFHGGRFRRVEKYRWLQAEQSVAEIRAPLVTSWYARHLPAELVLGDPASRDAALHSIQACIPHKTILPTGIDRIVTKSSWAGERATVCAVEKSRDGDDFLYDVSIQNAAGQTCESWEGLHLRAVAPIQASHQWPFALLVPYLGRKLTDFFPSASLKVALVGCRNGIGLERAIERIIGSEAFLMHRPDGKPEISGCPSAQISLSHCGQLTLMLSASSPVGCDLEQVTSRDTAFWEQMLGQDEFGLARLISQKCKMPVEAAATHLWSLKESLRKAGAACCQPIRLESAMPGNWVIFSAGGFAAATFHAHIEEADASLALAFVVRKTQ